MENSYEVNFDGLPGPTHNYAGLAYGNLASMNSQYQESNPRAAALQSLKKMLFMGELGLVQGIFPPHERPYFPILREIGYRGTDVEIAQNVSKESLRLYLACCAASYMWAANAATVTPSVDAADDKVHFTPANLISQFHRSIEPASTALILKRIFSDPLHFIHHDPLPPCRAFADEGAANHTRLCKDHGSPGIHFFVYGRNEFHPSVHEPSRYPARQTSEAFEAIIKRHRLYEGRYLLTQQNPIAIDAGVFHNDVIAVGHRNVLLYHENAYMGTKPLMDEIRKLAADNCGIEMIFLPVAQKEISLEEAVSTYLFNSQIVDGPDGSMQIIAPSECRDSPAVHAYLDRLVADGNNPINAVHYLDVQQSMKNGGGPACLRLRIPLKESEIKSITPNILLSAKLYDQLAAWVEKHYRDRLTLKDLNDPHLIIESQTALDELTKTLKIGSIYSFQK